MSAPVGVVPREPIPFTVVRFRCPSCGRTSSSKSRTHEHMGRRWRDPANRGCKTCIHYDEGDSADWTTGYPGSGEGCVKGIDLSGRPACARCGGYGTTIVPPDLGVSECGDCAGDGAEVKSGPIVHCPEWEPNLEVAR